MHKKVTIEEFKTWNKEQRYEYGKNIPDGKTFDENSNKISWKYPKNGWWYEYIFDDNGKVLTCIDSNGYWSQRTYNENGKILTLTNSKDYWSKTTYDKNGKELTFANSDDDFYIKGKKVTKEEYEEFMEENNA